MSTRTCEVIWGGRIMGAKVRAEAAREDARKAVRAADGAEAESVVSSHGGLWRTSAAIPNDRPVHQRRVRLAGNRMLPMQDPRKLAAGCPSPTARYSDMEA